LDPAPAVTTARPSSASSRPRDAGCGRRASGRTTLCRISRRIARRWRSPIGRR
jgi:hypothetical protein